MEYLVEMKSRAPAGTPPAVMADLQAREAVRARELAAEGTIVRLWQPAASGRRTFGLFTSDEHGLLDKALASMPLHMWRSYEITPLSWHPDDPGAERGHEAAEFLTRTTITVPAGTSGRTIDELKVREAICNQALAQAGLLVRLWTPPIQPGLWQSVGLWSARDLRDLQSILASLPLHAWMTAQITPLS
ncbi:hypothetical protein BST27_00185 [Mycobacterium intermedium]|uniref:Muconolactone isomerase domain-containing protein n=1 Tax=Mycobacterium intermedium TaxID=28445 RepID=A0A1E3SFG3_MYCIE|nr:muconolactone Delta-isomerase family protein [Mycobacterium intermedium]MCV6966681.1 muconolactone Delta-isomerase family protein [Mycobacterium intermedium]ODR00802.1 hypothetical protein BHQ20_11465 [Mycobacterium intermedium]OPE52120.1 hypothetical protein BV508_03585 [Mycobacterium intermedium]ORB10592.1 hypothetical protein BST27_00185 [Mycobacterium intermedium]